MLGTRAAHICGDGDGHRSLVQIQPLQPITTPENEMTEELKQADAATELRVWCPHCGMGMTPDNLHVGEDFEAMDCDNCKKEFKYRGSDYD